MSVSARSAITTAAAWIDELRTIPSRPWATSTICLATPSRSTSARSGWRGGSPPPRGVGRRVADDPLEALGDVDDLLGDAVPVDLGTQRLAGSQALLEARR